VCQSFFQPNGLRFCQRRAAVANTTDVRTGTDSITQKQRDLARWKAVACKRLLGGAAVNYLHYYNHLSYPSTVHCWYTVYRFVKLLTTV